MLILGLDALVLIILFMVFSGGDDLNWGRALLTAFAISLFSFACIYFLYESVGLFSLLPCLLVAPVMLWLICDLPLKQSMIAGTIFTAYRIALVFALVFGSSSI